MNTVREPMTIPNTHRLVTILLAVGMTMMLLAPVAHGDDGDVAELRERLQAVDPNFEPDEIRPTPVDGLFEVVSGANVFYVTADGRFMLRGQVIDLENNRNLTAERQQQLVRRQIESVGEDNMLVYKPSEGPVRHSITVFTDTTCPYCRQLHLGLMDMVEQYPVEVRYLLFPRAGLGARSADTMRNVWCAADPQEAMTAAKTGGQVAQRSESCETPIAQHYNLGRRIGISGTPWMLVDDQVVPGYRANEKLLRMMGLDSPSED
ncbi:MAG: DsbC family protein [Halofilum sp. (in: g-proteobacteria)]|nr:DsbC family protein [Halofilum sp. (in: g-proteobacteria)]